ncbi:hypothetical protein [Streptomyces sp. YIM S03343]
MFEIRVICDPADVDQVVTALGQTFDLRHVQARPTRDRRRTRLYATADHHMDPRAWPSPRDAYALAPTIADEFGWMVDVVATAEGFAEMDRDFYLRRAALLDRMALRDEFDLFSDGDAAETAQAAALYLLDMDKGHYKRRVPAQAEADPRGYVRREYAAWRQQEQRRDRTADHPDA